jgi:hypothetical protein
MSRSSWYALKQWGLARRVLSVGGCDNLTNNSSHSAEKASNAEIVELTLLPCDSQEPIKSRSPQLHVEYRFYKALATEGVGRWFGLPSLE